MEKRVLIIPDVFNVKASGALVAKTLADLLIELKCTVGVFNGLEDNLLDEQIHSKYSYFNRKQFNFKANFINTHEYAVELLDVIDQFKPSHIISVGGIVNRPLVYFDVIKNSKILHAYLIFCQDFYCARIHAALGDGPCTKCLNGSYLNAFYHNCAIKTGNNPFIFLGLSTINKLRLKSKLKSLDFIMASSEEQLSYYEEYGIEKSKIKYLPLFFPYSRLENVYPKIGDYFVISGQNRLEKGAHLLIKILPLLNLPIKIKIAFASKSEANSFVKLYNLQDFIDNGILDVLSDVSWDKGLKELYAHARGVLITSIWPTTTEFAFLEALGLSKPLVTFGVGIHKERIINYENGFQAKVGNFEEFAHYVNLLNENYELCLKVSKEAKKLYNIMTNKVIFKNILSSILLE